MNSSRPGRWLVGGVDRDGGIDDQLDPITPDRLGVSSKLVPVLRHGEVAHEPVRQRHDPTRTHLCA
jgi:hypothetical protein